MQEIMTTLPGSSVPVAKPLRSAGALPWEVQQPRS
jgi:hypothetical protein